MLSALFRNYKNAGANIEIALLFAETPDEKNLKPLGIYRGTGLQAHDLASRGRRELLRQAMSSVLRPRRGEQFEDIAWSIAALSVKSALPQIISAGIEHAGFALPYLCFLAEHLSLKWEDGETRDVFVYGDGSVWVHGIGANLRSYDVSLKAGQDPTFRPA